MQELEVADRFRQLSDQIADDTALLAFDQGIIDHPNFQEIIGMGEIGIRLMLEDLRDRESLRWFLPIYRALGHEPVCPPRLEDYSNYHSCRTALLAWGESAGYLL